MVATETPCASEGLKGMLISQEDSAAIRQIGQRLGNTVAVCRRAYVHPAVLELYLAGNLKVRYGHTAESGLQPEERATLRLLRDWSADRRD